MLNFRFLSSSGFVLNLMFVAGFAALPFAGAQAFEATAEQRAACTPDAFRLCSAEIPDEARVAQCMIANKSRLSARCLASFHPSNRRQVTEVRRLLHAARPERGGHRLYTATHRFWSYRRRVAITCDSGGITLELCNASGGANPSPGLCQHYRACYSALH